MSLLSAMSEDFYIMNKAKTPDGEGGFTTMWTQSTNTFKAILVHDTSIQARVAEKDGTTNTYTVTTEQSDALAYNDVIKRAKDSKYYRITSDAKVSPMSVTNLNMAQVTAERWELTT